MNLLTPLGLIGLISLIALIIIYIIKPNYQNKIISSTFVWKLSLKYSIESFLFGIRTALAFCGLFIISLFFPVIGQILLIICMGYFLGLSYIICSANRNGTTVGQLKKAAGKRIFVILGFGVSAYFLLMIPLAAIIVLPGLVLGGSELFNRELKEYV